MSRELASLERAGASNLVYTEIGEAWATANPEFLDVAELMCACTAAEEPLRECSTYIGSGIYSEVRSFGAAAIKVSSATTGKKTSRMGERGKPEHLVNQFLFLSHFGEKLDHMTDGEITTPDQYLAFKTPYGNYVRVEEHMRTWITISDFNAKLNLQFTPEEGKNNKTVKARLISTLRDPVMRMGLNDLGLEKNEHLHSKNVMIPDNTIDIHSAPLCIIDQPGNYRGYLGKISLFLSNFKTEQLGAARSI